MATAQVKAKGWIKNNDSGELRSFQYNPTTLSHSRGTTYSELTAPGAAYPDVQFVRGEARTFPFELYMYDNPSTGKIKEFELFLEEFMCPEENSSAFTRPPTMTLCYGTFIKKCVLESLSVTVSRMDTQGNTLEATFSLQLRQVGI